MPILFYAVAIVLLLISLRFKKDDGFLDKNSSNVIKGFFILLIVFSHILNAFPYHGVMSHPLAIFRAILGQLVVTMFFFISGYGIMYSIDSKGNAYSKSIITNRFLRILIYTIISLVPFFIYAACLNKQHPVQDYFLAIIGLRSFGNETWFILAILVCYALSTMVYLFKWKNNYVPAIVISAGIIVYIVLAYFFLRKSHTYNTIIAFLFGLFAYLFKNKINGLLLRKKFVPYLTMVISVIAVVTLRSFVSPRLPNNVLQLGEMTISNFFFCLFFVSLTKVFTLKSRPLSYLGKASYAIFLMHRIVICCFQDIGTIPNEHLNYLVIFAAAVLVGIPMYYIYKPLDLFVINPIVNWNKKLVLNQEQALRS